MKRTTILMGFILSTLLAMAQASVKAVINPIEMMIGEQAQVVLTIDGGENATEAPPDVDPGRGDYQHPVSREQHDAHHADLV